MEEKPPGGSKRPPVPISPYNSGFIDKERDARKQFLLSSLNVLVARELEKDPNFNITVAILDGFIKENPTMFPGVRLASTLISYFGGDLKYLRKKLGLPETVKPKPAASITPEKKEWRLLRNEKKREILIVPIKEIFTERRAKDTTIELTKTFLDAMVRNYPDRFPPGVTTGNDILNAFNGDINSIRSQLGQPTRWGQDRYR